jgi:hypothetical protein
VGTFQIHELLAPEAREILNGNGLCGSVHHTSSWRAARYLAIGLVGEDRLLLLAFATEERPDPTQENGLCGSYSYRASEF